MLAPGVVVWRRAQQLLRKMSLKLVVCNSIVLDLAFILKISSTF